MFVNMMGKKTLFKLDEHKMTVTFLSGRIFFFFAFVFTCIISSVSEAPAFFM